MKPEKRSKGDHREAKRLMNAGRDFYNGKNYEKAEQHFRRALIEDDQYAWAMTFLGHTLYKQNRHTEAVHAWELAVEMDPDSDAASKARRKLQHVEKQDIKLREDLNDRLRNL